MFTKKPQDRPIEKTGNEDKGFVGNEEKQLTGEGRTSGANEPTKREFKDRYKTRGWHVEVKNDRS